MKKITALVLVSIFTSMLAMSVSAASNTSNEDVIDRDYHCVPFIPC